MNKPPARPNFKLIAFTLYPVGGYVEQFRYPYVPAVTPEGFSGLNYLSDPRQSSAITPELVAGFATDLFTYSDIPSPATILGGWAAERYALS